jgi:hypothetical protein
LPRAIGVAAVGTPSTGPQLHVTVDHLALIGELINDDVAPGCVRPSPGTVGPDIDAVRLLEVPRQPGVTPATQAADDGRGDQQQRPRFVRDDRRANQAADAGPPD